MSWFPHYASSPLELILIVFLLPLAFCPSWDPIVPNVRAMQTERNYNGGHPPRFLLQVPQHASYSAVHVHQKASHRGTAGQLGITTGFPFLIWVFKRLLSTVVKMVQIACLLLPGFPMCGASWAWKSAAYAVKSRGSWEKAFLFFRYGNTLEK